MKKLFSSLSLLIALLFIPQVSIAMDVLSDVASQNTEIPPMDTSHWITHPVGRHLIDLPPNAKFYWYPLRFRGEFDLVWKKDMTIEQAKEILLQEAEEAKKAPHESGKSQFIFMVTPYGVNGDGIILARYPHKYASSYLFKTYFVNLDSKNKSLNKNKRVYYYEEEVIDLGDRVKERAQFIDFMSNYVSATYPSDPIEIIRGMYFEGGLFYGPSDAPYPAHEEIGIEVTFPEYPGIKLNLFFDHFNLDTESTLKNVRKNSPGMLRKAQTTLAGNPAEEVLSKFEEEGVTHYSFSLNAPSKKIAVRKERNPIVLMYLKNPIGGIIRDGKSTIQPPIRRPSFKSDEEAMAFWDAIRRNIRWRPDNWKIDAPEDPYYMVGGKMIPYVAPSQAD